MTWTMGAITLGYGVALADIRITRRRASDRRRFPEIRFGVAKLRAVTANAVVGFAGDLRIGLDLTRRLRLMAEEREHEYGSNVFALIEPDTFPLLLPELQTAYLRLYQEENRANGCSLLVVGVSPSQSLLPGTGGPPLAFGHIIRFPRASQGEASIEPLLPPARSIGKGRAIAAYREALEQAANPADMWKFYEDVWHFSRQPNVPTDFYSALSRHWPSIGAENVAARVSAAIDEVSEPSVSRNLHYAVVTKERVSFNGNYTQVPMEDWPIVAFEWEEVLALMDKYEIAPTAALLG